MQADQWHGRMFWDFLHLEKRQDLGLLREILRWMARGSVTRQDQAQEVSLTQGQSHGLWWMLNHTEMCPGLG